jgi:hypothetical protein
MNLTSLHKIEQIIKDGLQDSSPVIKAGFSYSNSWDAHDHIRHLGKLLERFNIEHNVEQQFKQRGRVCFQIDGKSFEFSYHNRKNPNYDNYLCGQTFFYFEHDLRRSL